MRYWTDPFDRRSLATTGDAEPAPVDMDEITAGQYAAWVLEAERDARAGAGAGAA